MPDDDGTTTPRVVPPPGANIAEWNEDWIKTLHWDLPFDDLLGLLRWVARPDMPEAEIRERLARFMKRPAAVPMPAGLRAAVEEILSGGPLPARWGRSG